MSTETTAAVVTSLNIFVNGEQRQFPQGTTLSEVVRSLGLSEDRVAMEYNRLIVSRPLWETTLLEEGAEMEIVQFVGGG